MEVLKVRLGLAVAMGIWIVVVANHWNQWMPHSSLLLTTAVLSFAGAIGLGAYRMKFLEEKFGVLEIPARLPLSIVPLVYILSIGILGILRWLLSVLMLRIIT